jgi:hypothetical protein
MKYSVGDIFVDPEDSYVFYVTEIDKKMWCSIRFCNIKGNYESGISPDNLEAHLERGEYVYYPIICTHQTRKNND